MEMSLSLLAVSFLLISQPRLVPTCDEQISSFGVCCAIINKQQVILEKDGDNYKVTPLTPEDAQRSCEAIAATREA
jgi:hypothetical protein